MVEYTPRNADDVFLALADATRRDILSLLRKGEKRITEIAERYPVSLNAVSKHLKVLERAGLIRREVVGREHWCTLDAGPIRDVKEWASFYEQFWSARLDAMQAAIVKRRAAKGKKR